MASNRRETISISPHFKLTLSWGVLLMWVVFTIFQASYIRSERVAGDVGGRVLGIESVISDQDTLEWRGPQGRKALVNGDKVFETWRHPYFSGSLELPGQLVVDRTPGWGESVLAAWNYSPSLHSILLMLTVAILWVFGNPIQAICLGFWLRIPGALSPAYFFDSDVRAYHNAAQGILDGSFPSELWPIGWPGFLSLFYLLGGGPESGRILGVLLGVVFIGIISAMLPSGRARITGVLVAALSSELIAFSSTLFSEPLFLVLVASTLLMMRSETLNSRGIVLAGLLGSAATLVRAVAFPIFPIMALLLIKSRRLLLLFGFVFLTPIAIWSVTASIAHNDVIVVANSSGINLWIGHGPGSTGDWRTVGPEPAQGYGAAATEVILAAPIQALNRVVRNASRLWSFGTSSRTMATRPLPLPVLPFGLLVVLGLVGAVRSRDPVLICWLVLATVSTSVFFAPMRYKLILYSALIPLAGLAFTSNAKTEDSETVSLEPMH
jgi:hypothetical protein